MKKIVLSLSVAFAISGLNAQQTEIKATNAAFNSKNYSEAIAQAAKAEAKLVDNYTTKPEVIAEFYFNAGQAAKASGNMILAAEYFSKLAEIENSSYWKAKNKSTKEWEYFLNEPEAKKITSAGNYGKLKEAKLAQSHLSTIIQELNDDANKVLNEGNTAFKAQNYQQAGEDFLKAYYLYKAVGKSNETLKYYSALAFLQTDEKQKAAEMLQSLVDENFTGVVTNYYAIDKASGQKVAFGSKKDMDTQVKLGIVSSPEVEVTESLEEELYSNATFAWYSLEDWDKTLLIGNEGLKRYPSNANINKIITSVYYKTGNLDQFIQKLQDKVDNGTANKEDYFNLAKSLEDSKGDVEVVKSYYKKAIELDPNFGDAYLNLAFVIIKPEQEYVALMNENLGSSAKEKKIYNDNKAKREELYRQAIPLLEKAYEQNPDKVSLIKILKTSYDVIGDDENYFKFKKLYDEKIK